MLTLPSFYREFASRSENAGTIVAAFLASFIPNGAKYGHLGVDIATHSLAQVVVDHAPPGSVVGYLSRLAYAIFVPGASLFEGQELADSIRSSVDELNVELHPGEISTISTTIAVVEFAASSDHWRTLERVATEVARDLAERFPPDWRYPILVYPS